MSPARKTTKKPARAKRSARSASKATGKKKPTAAKKTVSRKAKATAKTSSKKTSKKTSKKSTTGKTAAKKSTPAAKAAAKPPARPPSRKSTPTVSRKRSQRSSRKRGSASSASTLLPSPHNLAPDSKLGTKYECFSCGAKFYDLKRAEALCPRCGEDQAKAPKRPKARRVPLPPVEEAEPEVAPKDPRRRTVLDEDEQEVEIEVEAGNRLGLDEPVDMVDDDAAEDDPA
ncbi:MAG: FYDLN acid domain-containing protein [Myxococcales bacterium]|nr:FYDLN acid domain-containing protein [Myxococcales bacterium]